MTTPRLTANVPHQFAGDLIEHAGLTNCVLIAKLQVNHKQPDFPPPTIR
jgi:hypothetical protein